jgi:hypothetical protein
MLNLLSPWSPNQLVWGTCISKGYVRGAKSKCSIWLVTRYYKDNINSLDVWFVGLKNFSKAYGG